MKPFLFFLAILQVAYFTYQRSGLSRFGSTSNRDERTHSKNEGEIKRQREILENQERIKREISVLDEFRGNLSSNKLDIFQAPKVASGKRPTRPAKTKDGAPEESSDSKLLKDAGARSLIWEEARQQLDENYGELFHTLNLNRDVEEKLRDYLADLSLADDDIRVLTFSKKVKASEELYRSSVGTVFNDIAQLLGSEPYAQLVEFVETKGARTDYATFANSLVASGVPLDIGNAKDLLQLWTDATQSGADAHGTSQQGLKIPERHTSLAREQLEQGAATLLTQKQRELLSAFLEEQNLRW